MEQARGENRQAALYAALAQAQGEFKPIEKNREVSIRTKEGYTYQFRYADLEQIISATRPALSSNGLCVIQRVLQQDGANHSVLETVLMHKDGGSITSTSRLPPETLGDLKQFGAGMTYMRRYAYSALLCVSADDDLDEDGQGAGEQPANKPQQSAKQAKKQTKQGKPEQYPDEAFAENYPKWVEAVQAGKVTPERIIAMASSKGALSDAQKAQINAIGAQESQPMTQEEVEKSWEEA